MKLICGVDIGNSTTEVTLGALNGKEVKFLTSSRVKTTGVKGTIDNVSGVKVAIQKAIEKANIEKKLFPREITIEDIFKIRINEASPVIGESTMETISETIITDSAMIGHNPDTPGGEGIGVGIAVPINYSSFNREESYIVVVDKQYGYEETAVYINELTSKGITITGAIIQLDEGTLISNRLIRKIPIVDEVKEIGKVPLGQLAAIEVAPKGKTIKTLSNPYGIATLFQLSPEETFNVSPIAKSLIGLKSGVVIKTPKGQVVERRIKAGTLELIGRGKSFSVDVNQGAKEIMKALDKLGEIEDLQGEQGTNVFSMINSVKASMAQLTNREFHQVKIKDMLAVDLTMPVKVIGGIAEETYDEKAVAIAAMVKTDKLPLKEIKDSLEKDLRVSVEVEGVEAVMATLGALTTRGSSLPMVIIDMGGGSTDVAILEGDGNVKSLHLAGAGELVTMLINLSLGLRDRNLAEDIKRNLVGKVESIYSVRLETGELIFMDTPIDGKLYGRNVVMRDKELLPIYKSLTIERIVEARKEAKRKVFIVNILRGLRSIAPMGNLHNISSVVLVGGSALDFELPDMIFKELSKYGILVGSGNIRGTEGPRHAVSTGLVLHSIGRD